MYTDYFGFKEKPFNLTPDSHFLYMSAQHRDAMGHLLYGIRERTGFILISGEVGTGKTTLCRALIRRIEKDGEIGFILNTFLSAKELLKAVNDDLIGTSRGRTKKALVDELNGFLLRKHAEGRNVVLLIDECQNLSDDVLEQIRMLSNLETEKNKLLQIIMVGQPEIREKLARTGLRQLAQRISVSFHLQPLDYEETVNYIHHRLRVARGGEPESGKGVRFSRSALKRVFAYSGGVPRKINIVCDRALLIAFTRGKRKITDSIIRAAIREVKTPAGRVRAATPRRRRAAGWAAAAAGVVGAIALMAAGYRMATARGWIAAVGRPGAGPPRKEAPSAGVSAGGRENAPQAVIAAPAGVGELSAAAEGVPQAAEESLPVAAAAAAGVVTVAESAREAEKTSGEVEGAPVESAEVPAAVAEEKAASPEAAASFFLARLWGFGTGDIPEGAGEMRDPLKLASLAGMKAVSCWADEDFMRRVGVPCIVRLAAGPDGMPPVAVLVSLERDGTAVLRLPGGVKRLDAGELAARMRGKVTYFYPPGIRLGGLLAPGARGRRVADLQRFLAAKGILSRREDGWYGPETERAVRRFQAAAGLPEDGIVGVNESILIASARAGRGTPRLGAGPREG